MEHEVISRVESIDVFRRAFGTYERIRPAVIFGQRNKLTAAGPFLDLLRSFQAALEATTRLVVIGYSFRDDHVNTYIANWLNESQEHTVVIIDPGFQSSFEGFIGNLSTLIHSKSERLQVIRENASTGIEKFFRDFT